MVLLFPIYEQTIVLTIIMVVWAGVFAGFWFLGPASFRWSGVFFLGVTGAVIAAFTAIHWWIVWDMSRDNRRRRDDRRGRAGRR